MKAIRTKYQRAYFAANVARLLQKHPDKKVAAMAEAIVFALAAPIELVNAKIRECLIVAEEIVGALEE